MSLTVSNLSKKYGNKTVLDRLSFEMPEPGVYALLGTNGAGKTTTIRMMLGMLAKDSGEVLWNGKPLDTATCNVGYLAEERGLYPKYTLMDQLMYFAGLRGVSRSDAKKESATGRSVCRWRNTCILEKQRLRKQRKDVPKRRRRNPNWRISFPKEISRRSSL